MYPRSIPTVIGPAPSCARSLPNETFAIKFRELQSSELALKGCRAGRPGRPMRLPTSWGAVR